MDSAKAAVSTAAQQAEKTERNISQSLTVLWQEVPSWQQDNHYIQSGYRPASGSYKKSVKSLAYIHNETVNIYSHLLGAILAVLTACAVYFNVEPRYEVANNEDVFVFGCFFIGVVGCLGISATYHTWSNHSEEVAKLGNKLDYIGIVFLIWGSFIPSIYYGFACEKRLIKTYWAMITTIGAGCAIVCVHPTFRQPQWRPFRAAMFVAMGLSAVFPVFHGLKLYGIRGLEPMIGLRWLVLQGALYILGAGLYAARVPERYSPGRFDIWGSSHQIFHFLVVLAAAAHLTGLLEAFDFHKSHPHSLICHPHMY